MKTFLLAFLVFAFCSVDAQRAGTLDSSFGKNGKVKKQTYSIMEAVALQNNKILVAADTTNATVILRYNSDGSIDNSFGSDRSGVLLGRSTYINVLPNNKLIICGIVPDYFEADIKLTRLLKDGAIDSSFGENGESIINFDENETVFGSCVLTDEKILAAGEIHTYNDTYRGLLFRCNADGTLDKTFGKEGKSEVALAYPTKLNAIAVQKDGKIIVAGQTGISYLHGVVARFLANGEPDSSFGINGIIQTSFTKAGEVYNAVAIQSNGKIIASGYSSTVFATQGSILATRYNADGSLDKSFGKNGYTLLQIKPNAFSYDMKLQSNDKIVLTGAVSDFEISDFVLLRLTADGVADSSFGENGLQKTDFNAYSLSTKLLIQPDGKLVSCGYGGVQDVYNGLFLSRYYGDLVKQQSPIVKKIKRWIRNHTLNWQYNADVDYFIIEQSSNGINGFKEIAKVKSQNSKVKSDEQVYSYNLNAAANSRNYYRITAVSINGSKVVSTVISDEDVISIVVSPNPVKDVLKISGLPVNQKATISIINRNGNLLQSAVCNSSACNINVSRLRSGLYNVQVNVNGKSQNVKFVKE